jgi:hypothetical protein
LKEQIIKNIKLERDVLRVKIRQELCKSLFSVVELYLEALGSEPQFTHEIVRAIMQANGTALIRHVPGTVQDFTTLYRTVHNVPTEIHATAGMVCPRDTIRRTLISAIARTWEIYLKQQKEHKLCISLRKKAKEALQTQATEEAAIELDTELPVSNQTLQDLIQREATKIADSRLTPLRKNIAALKISIHPKNEGRGQPKGASRQKKKSQTGKQASNHGKVRQKRNATRGGTDNRSDEDSDWTTVSSRCRRNNPRHNQETRSDTRRGAGGANQDSNGGNGANARRRSRSRSKNRSSGGSRRSNRSSRG